MRGVDKCASASARTRKYSDAPVFLCAATAVTANILVNPLAGDSKTLGDAVYGHFAQASCTVAQRPGARREVRWHESDLADASTVPYPCTVFAKASATGRIGHTQRRCPLSQGDDQWHANPM